MIPTLEAISPRLPSATAAAELAYEPLSEISFADVDARAHRFAAHICRHTDEIIDILLSYETLEVAADEISRTLDLLRSLRENECHFVLRIGAVTSFLPKNQPLYALTCFVLVPSLMASSVHYRIHHSMKHFFQRLLDALHTAYFFPNVHVSHKERLAFLEERSALLVHSESGETLPSTDAVIFTGTPAHAEQLRLVFDDRTLFITNGSGHNPVVVSDDAKLEEAAEAALALQLYNQGQDCAAPNAILVHRSVLASFLDILRAGLRSVKVGGYRDRHCRVGPISDPNDLVRITGLFAEHREWLDRSTPGVIRTKESIVEPTIICKPLEVSGNYDEVFAPIFFVQEYADDQQLARYFENPSYARNAMYVTVYGSSTYVNGIIGRPFDGKVLHDTRSLLVNTHLHAPGIERGTEPYGGNGYGASNLSINGEIYCKATLPQRDIYEWVARPLLTDPDAFWKRQRFSGHGTVTRTRNVSKMLRSKARGPDAGGARQNGVCYVDAQGLVASGRRYVALLPQHSHVLLLQPDTRLLTSLLPKTAELIRSLVSKLRSLADTTAEQEAFRQWLYDLPKDPGATKQTNQKLQAEFFSVIYRLLFGSDRGPRLAVFLLEADREHIARLLDA